MSGKARPLHTEKDFPDELLQSIFAQAADGIFVANDQGRYIDVNPCGCEMLGYTRQEILELSIRDLIPLEDLSNNPLNLDELRAGRTIITERRLYRKDGTFLPVEINAKMLSNGNLLGIVRDITKRERAARLLNALNRSAEAMAGAITPEEVFSAAFHQLTEAGIHSIVLPLDKSNNCYIPLYLSIAPELLQMLEKLTGIKHEDFSIPIDVLDVFVQVRLENRAVFVENTESLVRQVLPEPLKGLASKIVKVLRAPKFIAAPMIADDTFYGIFSAESYDLTENELPSITAFAHQMAMSLRKAELFQQAQDEIAERKHAEEISRKSEERYHFLFENMLNGFAYCRMIFDKKNQPVDFIYLDVNKAFERLTGLKDVIKKRVTEVIPGIRKSSPELLEIYGNVALTGKPEKFETYLPEIDTWFSISAYSPKKDHFVAIFENITEHKQSEEALRKSEEKFRTVADFTYDWEYWVGVDGKHVYVSPSCERVTGYRPDEFMEDHKLLERIVHPEDHAIIEKHLREESEGVHIAGVDFRIIRKDGEERWINHNCMPVFGVSGQWLGRRASNRDITDRKHAEQAIEVLARYPAENPNPVLRVTPCGQIEYANAASVPLLEEWDCEIGSFLPADWQALIAEQVAVSSRKMVDISCKERVYSILIAPIEKAGYVNLYGRDVTERRRAEDKVRKSEERYRNLFENNPHPMWVYDLKTLAFLAVNDAAISKYGYTREEFLGMTIADIRPSDDQLRLKENLAQPRTALEHSEGWRHRLKDGTISDVEISSHTLNLDEHESVLVIAHDVTERKKAEARIRYITRLYATLSQVNQTIVRVKKRDELFKAICKVAVEFGQFRMAWIGLLDERTGDVNPTAHAGYDEGYLQSLYININDKLLGNSPTSSAIRTGKVVIADDIEADLHFGPLRERALERSYRSGAYVPIRQKEVVIGMLSLYATEAGFFNDEELSLLEEIGMNISFALDMIETETQRNRVEGALIESERRYRRTLSNMMEGCQIIDYDWRYIYINDAAAQQGHWKPEELLMHTMMEMYAGIEETELFRILRVCMEERHPHRLENKFIFPDGATGWFELSIQPVPEGLFILSIDITHRKKAEDDLRASEDRYRDLVENSRELICTHDLEGNILSANSWALKMMDADKEDLIGKNIAEFIAPEHRAEIRYYLDTIQREGRAQGSMLVQKASGERRIWEYNNSLRTEGVSTPIVRGMAIDITERMQAEAQLKASEEKYRSLFHNVPDGVYRTTVEGNLLAANPALVHMLGYDSEDDLQKVNIRDLYVDPNERLNFINLLGTEHEIHNLEVQLKCRDGRQIIGLANSRVVRGEKGTLSYFEGTLTDITERKQAEESLRASQEQLYSFIVQAPISIAMFDREMRYLAASQRWVVEYGRGHTDLIGLSHYEVHTDIPERWKEAHKKGLAGETLKNDNDFWLMEDETEAWLRWAIVPWRNPSDEIGGIIISAEDITGSKRAEQKIQQQLNRITALRDIDQMITSSFDLRSTMNHIVAQVAEQLRADALAILIFDPNSYTLDYLATRGLHESTLTRSGIRLGQGLAGNVALERRIVHYSDLGETIGTFPEVKTLIEDSLNDYYGVPLISKGQLRGVLEVFHNTSQNTDPEWLEYLETLAGQAAVAIDNIQMFDGLQRSNLELAHAYDTTIEGWSRALDMRDKETKGHTQRVTELTMQLARVFGLGEKELTNIRWGSLLHDIGKMGIPDAILLKTGSLTEDEWILMKKHPVFAYKMLLPIQYLRDALDIPLYHHEKWDGSGYPKGLKGEQIPLAARLFAIVDIWDALRSDRPYRTAWTKVKALEYIKGISGTHLDPQVVKVFFENKIYQLKMIEK